MNREAVAALIKRSRTDRGLPPKITDPEVLARIARIATAGGDRSA